VLDLVEAGRSVADVARDLEISDQSIYTWRRQDRIDRGLVPGLSSGERAELAKAKLRIAELETELRAMRQGPGPRLVRIGTEWFLAVSSGASRNVRPVAALPAVVTGCPLVRSVLPPECFVLLPECFGIQLPGALRSPPSRLRKVTAPKALQRHGRFLVQFLGAAVRFKLMRLRFGSALPCSRHSVRLVQCRCSPCRSWLSSLR